MSERWSGTVEDGKTGEEERGRNGRTSLLPLMVLVACIVGSRDLVLAAEAEVELGVGGVVVVEVEVDKESQVVVVVHYHYIHKPEPDC